MSRKTYPIHMAPTEAFTERVKQACGLTWILTGLEVVQQAKDLYYVHFSLRRFNGHRTQRVELGPKPTLAEIQDRTIEFLRA